MKRSGRDESIRVVIHLCMEAMLGIFLYSYPLSQTSKNSISFLLLIMSSLQQNWRRGQNTFCLEKRRDWREGAEKGAKGRREKWSKKCMHI
jgi:hypothetical protein